MSVRVRLEQTGLLPDRTQGAGVSRRLAGEVYWLALNHAASVMKGSNILQRTGIIGSNPIVAVLRIREVKPYQKVKRNTKNTN